MKRSEEIGFLLQVIDGLADITNQLEEQKSDLERLIQKLRLDREILIKILPRNDRTDALFRMEEFLKEREKEKQPPGTDGGTHAD